MDDDELASREHGMVTVEGVAVDWLGRLLIKEVRVAGVGVPERKVGLDWTVEGAGQVASRNEYPRNNTNKRMITNVAVALIEAKGIIDCDLDGPAGYLTWTGLAVQLWCSCVCAGPAVCEQSASYVTKRPQSNGREVLSSVQAAQLRARLDTISRSSRVGGRFRLQSSPGPNEQKIVLSMGGED